MDDYIWLTERARQREAAWAMTGSLLTHALLLFVLTFTDVCLPQAGTAGKKLDIIWLSSLSLSDEPLEYPEPIRNERRKGAGADAGIRVTAGGGKEFAEAAAVSTHLNSGPLVSSSMTAPSEVLSKETGIFQLSPTAAPEGAAKAKEPGGNDRERRASNVREQVSEVERGEYLAVERSGADAGSSGAKQAHPDATLPKQHHALEGTVGKAKAEVMAERMRHTASPDDLQKSSLIEKPSVGTDGSGSRAVSLQKQLTKLLPDPSLPLEEPAKGGATAVAMEKPERVPSVTPATADAEPSKSPAAAGIVYPSVSGDLKLVIERSSGTRLQVAFRELPRSKRGAPLSRAQSGGQKQVIPIYYKTKEGAAEAVIKTTQEGVYTFRVEDVTPGASVTLRLFEGSSKEKVAPLRGGSASQGEVLVKVLMPEGILWSDDSAFTGSLEDSSSTTKFNAQTGLYWREYSN